MRDGGKIVSFLNVYWNLTFESYDRACISFRASQLDLNLPKQMVPRDLSPSTLGKNNWCLGCVAYSGAVRTGFIVIVFDDLSAIAVSSR